MAKKKQLEAQSLYSVHPSIAYARAVLNNVPEKTGRSLAEWVELIRKEGPKGEKERRDWLKKKFKLGSTTAWMLVEQAEGKANQDTDPDVYLRKAPGYVEEMYAGPKAALRPLHDALIELGRSLGPDVKVCPCETIVPLYRHHVFAQIKPATQKRIDFGLALKGASGKLPARLIDTGGLAKKDRITHRIAITSPREIDAEVEHWLRVAYDLDVKE
jgi:uncharacterized protein DUF5655/uncharacterized protein DUF4287